MTDFCRLTKEYSTLFLIGQIIQRPPRLELIIFLDLIIIVASEAHLSRCSLLDHLCSSSSLCRVPSPTTFGLHHLTVAVKVGIAIDIHAMGMNNIVRSSKLLALSLLTYMVHLTNCDHHLYLTRQLNINHPHNVWIIFIE